MTIYCNLYKIVISSVISETFTWLSRNYSKQHLLFLVSFLLRVGSVDEKHTNISGKPIKLLVHVNNFEQVTFSLPVNKTMSVSYVTANIRLTDCQYNI